MKSEINMIRTYNNTSLLDSTTRLHYSPQGKTTCTACPVPCSTIGNSPVIRKKFGEPEIGSNSRTIIGQGITEALTDQQRQRGLLFVWGRRQRTGLAGYTEQNNHEICSSFISPKYQKRSRRIWCWQSRSLFTLTVISQKKTINWKHCTHTHTEGNHWAHPFHFPVFHEKIFLSLLLFLSLPFLSSQGILQWLASEIKFLSLSWASCIINHLVQRDENRSTGHQFSTVQKWDTSNSSTWPYLVN